MSNFDYVKVAYNQKHTAIDPWKFIPMPIDFNLIKELPVFLRDRFTKSGTAYLYIKGLFIVSCLVDTDEPVLYILQKTKDGWYYTTDFFYCDFTTEGGHDRELFIIDHKDIYVDRKRLYDYQSFFQLDNTECVCHLRNGSLDCYRFACDPNKTYKLSYPKLCNSQHLLRFIPSDNSESPDYYYDVSNDIWSVTDVHSEAVYFLEDSGLFFLDCKEVYILPDYNDYLFIKTAQDTYYLATFDDSIRDFLGTDHFCITKDNLKFISPSELPHAPITRTIERELLEVNGQLYTYNSNDKTFSPLTNTHAKF